MRYSWCADLNWTGLDWAGQELDRGEHCVCVSVVACIIGLGTTW